MEPGDEFVASRNLYGGSLTQFGLSFKKLGWTCHFVDPAEPGEFPQRADPEVQGDLHRESRQSGRRGSRHRARRRDRACGRPAADRRQHARDAVSVPSDRARRRHRRPFDDQVPRRATAMRSAAWWSNRENSTGRKAARFPSLTEPEPAYHGLKFFENFGDFAFTIEGARGGVCAISARRSRR